jgi:anti-sigma regulatory factor (Ser/Thr protein kinase)
MTIRAPAQAAVDRPYESFRHEALFYAGQAEFVDQASSFIRDAIRGREAVLVVVSAEKIDLLSAAVGPRAEGVHFADMAEVGRNPARIIPAWREFVADHAADGRRFRGVGEPIWAQRGPNELVECELHEALLNLAFGGSPAWWLMCPYDTQTLPQSVLEEAERNHPFVMDGHGQRVSPTFRALFGAGGPSDSALPEPSSLPEGMSFGEGQLSAVRNFVATRAAAGGLDAGRTSDLVFAANEVATNSLRHGGGRGTVRVWRDGDSVVCEVRDRGSIQDPLVGRHRPVPDQEGGLGLWLANQMCDLVQVRTLPGGSVVRLHVAAR